MDSANILSLLNFLGQGQQQPQTNVLQSVAPQAPMDPDNPAYSPPPQAPQAAPVPQSLQSPLIPPQQVAQAAVADAPPMPKPRRSLLDTIGRISDVLAKVGGADPLYQPTLDARANQMQQVDMNKLDLATKQLALSTGQTAAANSERDRFAKVLGAVSDAEDAGNMPQMMQAAGLTDPRYAPFVKMVQGNPETAKTLAAALGAGGDDAGKYSGNIVYAKDASGNLHAFQANQGSGDARDVLPAGMTPVDPLQFVNTGGAQVGVGKLSGAPKTILPNSASPNTVLTTNTQKDIAANRDRTTLTVAGMPARPKAAAGSAANNGFTAYNEARNGLTDLSHQLDAIINDPGLAHATGLLGGVERHILGTPAQRVLGNITTAKGQALSAAIQNLKALSAAGNLGFRLTQQEATAFGAKMAGALENTGQSASDYANNLRAAQGRLKAMINRLDQDAVRNKYVQATGQSAAPPGWSVVGVK